MSAGVSGHSSASCLSPTSQCDRSGNSLRNSYNQQDRSSHSSHGHEGMASPLPPYACSKPVWSAAANADGTYRPRAPWAPTQPRYQTVAPSTGAIQAHRSDSMECSPQQPLAPPTHTVLSAALADELQRAQLQGTQQHGGLQMQSGSNAALYGSAWGDSSSHAQQPLQLSYQLSYQQPSRRTSRDAKDSAVFQRGGAGAASCMRYLH